MRVQTTLLLSIVLFSLTSAPIALRGAETEAKPGKWQILFDGRSVDKWRGFKKNALPDQTWKVEEGVLKTIRSEHGTDIITKEKYDSFELELEWKVTPGANSGIMYHVSEDVEAPYETGPEMQVLDDNQHAEHWLNGAKVVEYELGSQELKRLIGDSKFKDMPRFAKEKGGYLDLQHHGDEVWYRKIRVRRL